MSQEREMDLQPTATAVWADYEWVCIECEETQYETIQAIDTGDLRCQSCGAHYKQGVIRL